MRKALPLILALLAACSTPTTPTPQPSPTPDETTAPEITSFTATPTTFRAGEAVKLEWTYTGAAATAIGLEDVNGPLDYDDPSATSGTIHPTVGGYVILTVTNPYGRDMEYVDLTLAP